MTESLSDVSRLYVGFDLTTLHHLHYAVLIFLLSEICQNNKINLTVAAYETKKWLAQFLFGRWLVTVTEKCVMTMMTCGLCTSVICPPDCGHVSMGSLFKAVVLGQTG